MFNNLITCILIFSFTLPCFANTSLEKVKQQNRIAIFKLKEVNTQERREYIYNVYRTALLDIKDMHSENEISNEDYSYTMNIIASSQRKLEQLKDEEILDFYIMNAQKIETANHRTILNVLNFIFAFVTFPLWLPFLMHYSISHA